MPTINTWISDSDYNKYLVVKQKGKGAWTEFIHNALNGTYKYEKDDVISGFVVDKTKVATPEIAVRPIVGVMKASDLPKPSGRLCRHGNPMGQCFDKGADRRCRV